MLEKLLLIIVEAALELVPPECRKHPSVVKDAKRRGKTPGEVLLDRSYHHAAMKELRNSHKRGRPDITHFSLLEALGSPLNRKGMLETYVATIDNYVIYVKPYVRLPKNYDRFKGLVEQLYRKQVITAEDGRELLSIQRKPLRQLLKELSPSTVLLMSEAGEAVNPRELANLIKESSRPAVLVGGFPHGGFAEETINLAESVVKIFDEPLEAWVAVSRILCAVEEAVL